MPTTEIYRGLIGSCYYCHTPFISGQLIYVIADQIVVCYDPFIVACKSELLFGASILERAMLMLYPHRPAPLMLGQR